MSKHVLVVEMSENQTQFLKGEVWRAARDGLADKIKVTLENVEYDIVTEILNHHTIEDGQSTTPLIIAVIQGHKDVVNTLINYRSRTERNCC